MIKKSIVWGDLIQGLIFGLAIVTVLVYLTHSTYMRTDFSLDLRKLSDVAKSLTMVWPYTIAVGFVRLLFVRKGWLNNRPVVVWPAIAIFALPLMYVYSFLYEAYLTSWFTESCCYESVNLFLWILALFVSVTVGFLCGFVRLAFLRVRLR